MNNSGDDKKCADLRTELRKIEYELVAALSKAENEMKSLGLDEALCVLRGTLSWRDRYVAWIIRAGQAVGCNDFNAIMRELFLAQKMRPGEAGGGEPASGNSGRDGSSTREHASDANANVAGDFIDAA